MLDVASVVGTRLNVLAMCSIEKDILDKIDLKKIDLGTALEDFVSRNARRCFFKSTGAL
jgi:hypothetical protein